MGLTRDDHQNSSAPDWPKLDVPEPLLTDRFRRACEYAIAAHAAQVRKGTTIPYASHLLGVAALVLEDGGSEDEAIAALLHDAVEDQGGPTRLAEIRDMFGERVAAIVAGCSDTDVQPKPPWRARKEAYLTHLATAPPEVVRVSLADKLHNARSILLDFRAHGDELWSRFDPEADQLWYYRSLLDGFRSRSTSPMVDELARVLTELETLTEPGGR